MSNLKRLILALSLTVLMPAVASAQITGLITFQPNTRALSSEVNFNFNKVASESLNRTGGTMTGTLVSQQITPSATNTYDLGVTGTRFRNLWLSGNATIAGSLSFTTINASATTGHAVGVAAAGNVGWNSALTATASGGLAIGHRIDGTITAAANSDTLSLFSVGQGGTWAKGAFTTLTTSVVRLTGSNITASGAGTITNASTLEVLDAPSVGTNNYAVRVVAGNTLLGGTLSNTGMPTTTSPPNVFISSVSGLMSRYTGVGFLAYNSATDAGLNNDSVVDFDTEVYDEAGNFAADTFTAPVTGRYLFTVTVHFDNNEGSPNVMSVRLITGNRDYYIFLEDVDAADSLMASGSVIVDMDSADTAQVRIYTDGGAGTIDVNGSGTPLQTLFSGRLVP